MSVNEKKINVDENVERIAALPEEYVKAVEDVVGNLDPDWRNKLVYNKYIAYLCDVFEDAVKKGLSVNEVIGDDRKAYADKIQAELKFMDITPTNKNKITNYLIIFDFIMYIGMSVFSLGAKNFSHAQTMDYVLMAIGAIVMFACMMMKLVKVKAMKNMAIIPVIQFVVALAIMPILRFEIYAGAIALGFNVLSDFVIIAKQKNEA